MARRSTKQNRRRFVRRRSGLDVVAIERDQDVRLRIVGRNRSLRDIVGDRGQVAHDTLIRFRAGIGHHADIDEIAVAQTAAGEILLIDEHDITATRDSAIAIIEAVDCRIV